MRPTPHAASQFHHGTSDAPQNGGGCNDTDSGALSWDGKPWRRHWRSASVHGARESVTWRASAAQQELPRVSNSNSNAPRPLGEGAEGSGNGRRGLLNSKSSAGRDRQRSREAARIALRTPPTRPSYSYHPFLRGRTTPCPPAQRCCPDRRDRPCSSVTPLVHFLSAALRLLLRSSFVTP